MIAPDVKRWLTSFGNVAVGETVTGLLRFFALVVVARSLGPERLGYLNVAVVAVGYLLALTHSGLDTLGMRDVARRGVDPVEEFQKLVALHLVLAVLVYPFVVLGTFMISDDPLMRVTVFILASSLFASSVDLRWLFIGIQRTRPVAIASTVSSALYLIAVLFLVRGPDDLVAAASVQACSELALAAIYAAFARRRFGPWRPRFDRSFARRAILKSFPVTALKTTRSLHLGFDVVYIKLLTGAADAGVYGAARRLTNIGLILVALMWTTFMPGFVKASGTGEDGRSLLRKALRFPLYVVLPAVLVVSLTAPRLIPWIFGAGYRETAEVFRVLVWAFVPLSFGVLLGQVMIARDQLKELWAITTVAAAVNIAAVMILYPILGLTGMAVAWTIAEGVALMGAIYALRGYLVGPGPLSSPQEAALLGESQLWMGEGRKTDA